MAVGIILPIAEFFRINIAEPEYNGNIIAAVIAAVFLLIGTACGCKDITVTGTVDHLAGQNRLAALLGLEGHADYSIALHKRLAAPGMAVYGYTGILYHVDHGDLQHFRINICAIPDPSITYKTVILSPFIDQRRVRAADILAVRTDQAIGHLLQTIQPLLLYACNHLLLSLAEMRDKKHLPAGSHTAQMTIALQQDYLTCTITGGGNRRSRSGGAGTDNQYIAVVKYLDFFCLLVDIFFHCIKFLIL